MNRRLCPQVLAIAAAFTLGACDLTFPWSPSPEPRPPPESTARFTVSPTAVDVRTTPGLAVSDARLHVSVRGLTEPAYLAYAHSGAAVDLVWWEPASDGADVFVVLSPPPAAGEATGSVDISVCLDEGCQRTVPPGVITVPIKVRTVLPGLAATPPSIELSWLAGTPFPSPATVAVSAANLPGWGQEARLSLSGAAAGWLSIAPAASVTVPGPVNVALVSTAPPAGVHSATLSVEAAGETLEIPVTLTVTDPVVTASPSSVALRAERGSIPVASETVALSLLAGESVSLLREIQYGAGASAWLDVTPSPLAPGDVVFIAVRADLPVGTYEAEVRLHRPGGGQVASIPVTYEVIAAAPAIYPGMEAVPFAFFAGQPSPPTARTIALGTPASDPIPFTVEVDYGESATAWLSAPASGVAPTSVELRPSRTDLPPGPHVATVRFVHDGVTVGQLGVSCTVETPSVQADGAEITFLQTKADSAPFRSAGVYLRSSGDVPLAWESAVDYGTGASGWLSVTASGTTPGLLLLEITRNDLDIGVHHATVHVRRPGGGADWDTVAVHYDLRGPDVIVTPDHLAFQGVVGQAAPPPAQTVSLSPADGQALQVSVLMSRWDVFDVTSTGTAPGTLTVRPANLAFSPGTRDVTLTVTSSISGAVLGRMTLSYTVLPAPLAASPASLAFGATQATEAASLTKALDLDDGGSPVAFTVTAPPWVTVSPSSGVTPADAHLSVTFDPTRAGTQWGSLTGDLVVTTSPPGATAPVELRVPLSALVYLPSPSWFGPLAVAEGDPAPVLLRGNGVGSLAAGTLLLDDQPVVDVTRVHDDMARVTLPSLAPGRHVARVTNTLGIPTATAAIEVVPVAAKPPASGPSQAGVRQAVIRDDVRGAVYAANPEGWVERWRDTNGLALERVSLPGLNDLALSPDGARLTAVTASAIQELDPVTLAPAAAAVSLPSVAFAQGWRIAYSIDGTALLVQAGQQPSSAYRYDPVARTVTAAWGGMFQASAGDVVASRDGALLLMVGWGSEPVWYDTYFTRTTPAEGLPFQVRPALNRSGTRVLPATHLTPQLFDHDLQPIAGTLGPDTEAALLSDDGARAFSFDLQGRAHVWDVSAPAAGGGTYPEVGTPGGIEPVVSPGANARIALSTDERTLYVVGGSALVVVPLP